MKENIKYFETLNDADEYIINDIPFICYIKENELVLFNNDLNKMIIILNNKAIVHNTVDVIFETLNDADGYIIETIPFSCYIKENYLFLECNLENCKIVVKNGIAAIKEMNDIIKYAATSKVTPYQPSSLPTIISNDFDSNTGQGVIKFTTDVTNIGNLAFRNSSGMTSITIPNSVTNIGAEVFIYCKDLISITIPNSVISIGNGAFFECTGLTSVTIDNSVTSIGSNAFWGCISLISIDVASDNSNYCSEDGVLFNKDKTILIQYPGGIQGSYTIPNSVTSIGNSAFVKCAGLTSVTIPNSVTSIGDNAFRNCTSLTSVTIPNSVTSIGGGAFKACSGLRSIEIPNNVTSIGNEAFYNCSDLTSIRIGNSVTSIGEYAFCNCSGLTSISYVGTVSQYNSITKKYNWHYNVPATVVHCIDGDTPI